MKHIPTGIYRGLTHDQRVPAVVAALARNDNAEAKKLVSACPKKDYRMTDDAFTTRMTDLFQEAMAYECDMRAMALNFYANGAAMRHDEAEEAHAQLVALEEAWRRYLESKGVTIEEMHKAMPVQNRFVFALLEVGKEHGVTPDEETVQAMLEVLNQPKGGRSNG